MKIFFKNNTNLGQALIELVVIIGISAIIIPALLTALIASRNGKPEAAQRAKAVAFLKETEEAVRSLSGSNWNAFAINGTFYPVVSGSSWSFSPGSQTVNGLTRQVLISDTLRNSSGTIVQSGGTVDPSTKTVVITISWTSPISASLVSTMYFTRTTNQTYLQTTVADFTGSGSNTSTLTGTAITNTSGGEVELGKGNANWCKPQNYIINQLTLPKLSNAIYAVPGKAYLGAGDGNPPAFINVSINTPAPPASPSASIAGTYNAGSVKTNAIYSDGSYVYLATDSSTQILILQITTLPYIQVGTVTIPGGQPANGVYVSGNTLYATSGNSLYSFDITAKAGPHIVALSSQNMYAGFYQPTPSARQVFVANNRVFVGTGNTWFGLQVFKINNNGTSFSFVGASNLTYNQLSQGLVVNQTATRAYVAFNNGSGWTAQGFFIVDISSDPPWWWPFYSIVGQYSAAPTDPTGMTVVPGNNRAIIVGTGGTAQYQVVDISNESNPTLCGSLAVQNGIYGISSVLDLYNNAYSYIITGDNSQFKIIQGGNGGTFAASGTFESNTFDPGFSTAFNRFVANIAMPSQTNIQMQVSSANAVNGSCAGAAFTYVGPNGDPSAYFTPVAASISGSIPLGNFNPNYQNPARCFRYKAWLSTTDTSQTPVLYDMTVNYSP